MTVYNNCILYTICFAALQLMIIFTIDIFGKIVKSRCLTPKDIPFILMHDKEMYNIYNNITYFWHISLKLPNYLFLLWFTVKVPRPCESDDSGSQLTGGERNSTINGTGCLKTSATESHSPPSHLTTRFQTPAPTNPISETSDTVYADQDQPLFFDSTRLAMAAAAFRGLSHQQGFCQTQSLARVLQSGLPNLNNAHLGQRFLTQSRDTVGPRENDDETTMASDAGHKGVVQEHDSHCKTAERIPGNTSNAGTTGQKTCHVLGLDCYSSSDEESDTW